MDPKFLEQHAMVNSVKMTATKRWSFEDEILNDMPEGGLIPEAVGILSNWSKRTIARLLLMPPTRHNFLHLNEVLRIKQQVLRLAQISDRATSIYSYTR